MTTLIIAPDTAALEAERRHAAVVGLTDAAIFIETHPDLPLGNTDPLRYSVRCGTDEQERAEVDRIAGILGVAACDPYGDGDAWQAERDFGGGVAYRATAISRASMDSYSAHMAGWHRKTAAA